jgi:hypothetical protein
VPDRSGIDPQLMERRRPWAARAIYGQILVLSVVAAYSEDRSLSTWEVLGAVAGTLFVFWLAHVYSEALAERMEMDRGLRADEVMRHAHDELPLVIAASPVALILLLGGIGVFSHSTAIDVALWAGIASLAAWEFEIGRRSGFGWWKTLLGVAIGCALGLVIVVLKTLIH